MYNRIEVFNKNYSEGVAENQFKNKLQKLSPALYAKVEKVLVVDIFWLHWPQSISDRFESYTAEVFTDPLLQQCHWNDNAIFTKSNLSYNWAIEKSLLPGMTDNLGTTVCEAFSLISRQPQSAFKCLSGQMILIQGSRLKDCDVDYINRKLISNPYIHRSEVFIPQIVDSANYSQRLSSLACQEKLQYTSLSDTSVQTIPLLSSSSQELIQLSQKNLLSLNLAEMESIQNYFKSLGRNPTDVELEVIAQTWSEHCKHKIFAADVTYTQSSDNSAKIPPSIKSLFKTMISKTTAEIPKPWLVSVFTDNAGIVAFDSETAVCIKVETHNSPSALDPFGGAITGIVGVNRDILGCGLGAKPIFNTNVFCVGPLDKDVSTYKGLIPPAQILEGVRSGVEHGGNQSGIPTVNGALYFDDCYIGKPLVFCGTGGVIPLKIKNRSCAEKKILPGDLICMLGGRIGRDGIHGATFSSLEMTESIPASVVQLGDPITQKRMTDFLLEARDQGLYRCITDNGAGGLSSSIGELAQISNGARLDVTDAKTKMPGLRPFELVISESQERMSLAVDPSCQAAFVKLASERNVEFSFLGEFTDSGKLEIIYKNEQVALLDLAFLHKGVPTLQLQATWNKPDAVFSKKNNWDLSVQTESIFTILEELLQSPQIRSKESMIRQYDHEVQGRSVIKSLQVQKEQCTPNDAAVIALDYEKQIGVAVSCGLSPRLSKVDPWYMAQAVVDEAVRNLLSVGAEFSTENDLAVMSLVDNFCWPDPVEDQEKMAALVRTCAGLRESCLKLKLPLISGKDSMKNDYKTELNGKKVKVSVLPTLLMTALGRLPDYNKALSADFKNIGDIVYILGPSNRGLLESEWHHLQMNKSRSIPANLSVGAICWDEALALYNWMGKESYRLQSCHDVSDGGVLTALAESCFRGNLGLNLNPDLPWSNIQFSFGEGLHQLIVSIRPEQKIEFETEWSRKNIQFLKLAVVEPEKIQLNKQSISTQQLFAAWSKDSL